MDPAAVQAFCEATGASAEEATALLTAYNGNLEAAVGQFFGARLRLRLRCAARGAALAACAALRSCPCARCVRQERATLTPHRARLLTPAPPQRTARAAKAATTRWCVPLEALTAHQTPGPKCPSHTAPAHSLPWSPLRRPLRRPPPPAPLPLRRLARSRRATCALWRTWQRARTTTTTTGPSKPSSAAPRGARGATGRACCARGGAPTHASVRACSGQMVQDPKKNEGKARAGGLACVD